jgi:hypothetical protein
MYQERVPIGPPDNRRYIEAHLIDCRSHGGFSGAPCFVQATVSNAGGLFAPEMAGITHKTRLLGLISAHFDDKDSTRVSEIESVVEIDVVGQRINSGVGVVTPSERIVEALNMADVREERERIEAEHVGADEEGATPDTDAPEIEAQDGGRARAW